MKQLNGLIAFRRANKSNMVREAAVDYDNELNLAPQPFPLNP